MSSPSTKHGSITARQWQDIRQGARLARTEGVQLILHGLRISPVKKGQEKGESPCHPHFTSEPAKTVRDNSRDESSSKKERDARRAKEFRARKGVAFRWELLTTKLKRIEKFHLRSVVWVQWMKAKPMKECIQARFTRGAVAATVSGGDPDGRKFYEFDDPACALIPGLRQEPIHMSEAKDLKPIQERLTDPPQAMEEEASTSPAAVANHTLSPHAAVFTAAPADAPRGGNRSAKKSSKKKR